MWNPSLDVLPVELVESSNSNLNESQLFSTGYKERINPFSALSLPSNSFDDPILSSASSEIKELYPSLKQTIEGESETLQQQRKIAEEQLLLYQRMVEAESRSEAFTDVTQPALLNNNTGFDSLFPPAPLNRISREVKLPAPEIFRNLPNNSGLFLNPSSNSFFPSSQPKNLKKKPLAGKYPVLSQRSPYMGADNFMGSEFGINSMQQQSSSLMFSQQPTMFSNSIIYQVQFKVTSRFFIVGPTNTELNPFSVGEFVVVEADRGQDLGVVTALLTTQQFSEKRQHGLGMSAENSRVRRIVRTATLSERQALVDKHKDEQTVVQFCCQLVLTVHGLPITVYEAEYQFDRKKLTIYYDSSIRVDFRELVRDLFAAFKARIWMEKINLLEEISDEAVVALATGVSFMN